MISRETIDEIKNRVDIYDVVSDFVSLKKSGQNYKGLSPFNNEKTPSFFVVPAKGIFKDFSSGKGGDAFTFVMEHEKMSYVEAIRYLAKKYGVEIKEDHTSSESKEAQSERESLYILMNFAKDFYKHTLAQSDEGRSIGLSYFRERGFNDRTLEKFELGYALEGWENFSKEAISKGYNKELLEKTGLVVKKEDGSSYDRFRGRVIFPVHGLSGKVVAFGARMLGKEKNQPKYINSPETEIYHKSDVLYGLYQGKNSIRQHDVCYLVEGYTDVISMHQADVENVVASSGTALTENQIKLIRRFTENITVLFDGDNAGIKAALRGIDMILRSGLNVRVLLFPDGEDPDSFSRKVGTTEFQKYLKQHTQDFVSFKAGLYAKEAAGDPIRKAESIKEIVSSIAFIPDPIKRSVYIQETSNLLKIGEDILIAELNKAVILNRKTAEKARVETYGVEEGMINEIVTKPKSINYGASYRIKEAEKSIIQFLINFSDAVIDSENIADFVFHEISDVKIIDPINQEILEYIQANSGKGFKFSEELSDQAKALAAELATKRYKASPNWIKRGIYVPEDAADKEKVIWIIKELKFWHLRLLLEDEMTTIKEKEEALVPWEELENSLENFFNLKKFELEIAEDLGYVIAV